MAPPLGGSVQGPEGPFQFQTANSIWRLAEDWKSLAEVEKRPQALD